LPTELIKQFLEAGCISATRPQLEPKMKKFIFGERSKIYIIDLEKTQECLQSARDFVLDITSKGNSCFLWAPKSRLKR